MQHTESEWGRHLITIRGFQHVMASLGDTYAAALTTERDAIEDRMSVPALGTVDVTTSQLGPLVITNPDLVTEALTHAPLGTSHPRSTDESPAALVDHVGEQLWETWNTCHVLPLGPSARLSIADYQRLSRYVDEIHQSVDNAVATTRKTAATALADLPSGFDALTQYVTPTTAAFIGAMTGTASTTVEEFLRQPVRAFDALLCPPRIRDAQAALTVHQQLLDAVADAVRESQEDSLPRLLAESGASVDDQLSLIGLICVFGSTAIHHAGAEAIAGSTSEMVEDTPTDWVDRALRRTPPSRFISRIAERACRIGDHDVDEGQHLILDVTERVSHGSRTHPLFLTGNTYEPLLRPVVAPAASVIVEELRINRGPISLSHPHDQAHLLTRVPLSLTRANLLVTAAG